MIWTNKICEGWKRVYPDQYPGRKPSINDSFIKQNLLFLLLSLGSTCFAATNDKVCSSKVQVNTNPIDGWKEYWFTWKSFGRSDSWSLSLLQQEFSLTLPKQTLRVATFLQEKGWTVCTSIGMFSFYLCFEKWAIKIRRRFTNWHYCRNLRKFRSLTN